MKAIFINGSPRKNWNTAQMLDSAMKGVTDAGFVAERVNLVDYEFYNGPRISDQGSKKEREHGMMKQR